MEVRTCKRCGRCFAWDSGPVDHINSCPRCSGAETPTDHLAAWVVKGCVVMGCVLAGWVMVDLVKFIFKVCQ